LELYSRVEDSAERNNLAPTDKERTTGLDTLLKSELTSAREAGRAYTNASVPRLTHKDALEALGYFE
jgi:hypothetical protein